MLPAYVIIICFVFVENAILEENGQGLCKYVTLSEDNQKMMTNLDTFLERNLYFGIHRIRKVLGEFGESSRKLMRYEEDEPLEIMIIRSQLLMHQQLTGMIAEIKSTLSRLEKSYTTTASNIYREPNYRDFTRDSGRASINTEDNSRRESDHEDSTRDSGRARINTEDNSRSYRERNHRDSTRDLGRARINTEDNSRRESDHEDSTRDLGRARINTEDNSRRPTDCSELLLAGHTESGAYYIYPFDCRCAKRLEVYCDMKTDGGGWTVFLNRTNASQPINFTRNWEDYKNGFGTLGSEYWLGNEALHTITFNKIYTLRLEASDNERRDIWGEWSSITVHNEDEKYKLVVAGYNAKSTAFDRFSYITNNKFSTYDSDNDRHGKNCPLIYKGGWWYNGCVYDNLTGMYGKIGVEGMAINPWSKTDRTVRYAAFIQLKIRPQICSSQVSIVQINKPICPFN